MRVLITYISILFWLLSVPVSGQNLHTRSNKALKAYNKGKSAYDFVQYNEAEKNLLEAIERDPGFIEAHLILAELYSDIQRYKESYGAYLNVINIDSLFYKPAFFGLGKALFNSGEYADSKRYLSSYLRLNGGGAMNADEANSLILDCLFALEAIKTPVMFNPLNMGESINTRDDEYWPAITADDKILLFTRQTASGDNNGIGTRLQEDFYMSVWKDNNWSVARNVGEPLNTMHNEGAQTLEAGGQYMFFTACNRIDGHGGCDIYYSAVTSRGWSRGINIDAPVNTPYWESQPSLSADGLTLYFVSNRPGGIGGMDIWFSKLKEDTWWSEPINMGDKINTPGNEMSPFIHFDGKTLYFSSDGRPCMGGLDIFMSRADNTGQWSDPENLGYPINTHSDEMGLIINSSGRVAYFSSLVDRNKGRDLFTFDLAEILRPDPVSYLRGSVIDKMTGKKIQASYELTNLSSNEKVLKSNTDRNGNFLICLPSGYNYGVNVSKENYLFYSDNFMLEGENTSTEPYEKRISLSPIREGEKMELHNVFFTVDSWILREESIIELTKLFDLLNNNRELIIEVGGHTDSSGSTEHNQLLSENRAAAVRDFLVEMGISDDKILIKGYGESKPVSENVSEEGKRRNRRTEIKIISLSQ